uniref:EKC/KEOPS complex subunit CGI121 n=2 Tax=Macrostomum lignano TaxID=282301 RepID=A0A1I8INR0_9PLAT
MMTTSSTGWMRYPSMSVPNVTISMRLFQALKNPAEVHTAAIQGHLAGALVSTELVYDSLHLLTAANQALAHQSESRMATKSIHTELLYCLSPTKNISQSLAKFGMNSSTASVVAVLFHPQSADNPSTSLDGLESKLTSQLDCESSHSLWPDTNPECDLVELFELYKVTPEEQALSKESGDSLSYCFVTRVACKDVVTV